jgi:molybdopterin-guanine dinucleotide biosynthesis protein A
MGTDKARVIVDGRPMADSVRTALDEVCDGVIVVGGINADVSDPLEGPLSAVAALLRSGRAERYLVAPVDQPRLAASVLQRLLDAREAAAHQHPANNDVGVAFVGEPLPLLIDAGARARIDELVSRGERRLRAAITVEVAVDNSAAALVNVNTPADVEALTSPRAATGRAPRA